MNTAWLSGGTGWAHLGLNQAARLNSLVACRRVWRLLAGVSCFPAGPAKSASTRLAACRGGRRRDAPPGAVSLFFASRPRGFRHLPATETTEPHTNLNPVATAEAVARDGGDQRARRCCVALLSKEEK